MTSESSDTQSTRPLDGARLDAALCFGFAALLLAAAVWQLARRASDLSWLTFAPDSYERAAAIEILSALWLASTGSYALRHRAPLGRLTCATLCVLLTLVFCMSALRVVQFGARPSFQESAGNDSLDKTLGSAAPLAQPIPLSLVPRRPAVPGDVSGAAKGLPLVAAEWRQYRRDNQKTGASVGFDLPAATWTTETGSPLRSTPVVAGNLVLVGAHGTGALSALDATTGRIVWQTRLPNGIDDEPVVALGIVVVGYGDDHTTVDSRDSVVAAGMKPSGVSARDLRTGARLWDATANGAVMTSPVVVGRTVIYGTALRSLVARDLQTGTVIWQRQLRGRVVMGSPAFADSIIIVAEDQRDICAYEARAGHELWCHSFSPEYRDVGHSSPSVAGGTVYVSAIPDSSGWSLLLHRDVRGKLAWIGDYVRDRPSPHYGKQVLAALDLRTGAARWVTPLGGGFPVFGPTSGTAVVAGGNAYVVSPIAQALFAVDARTGAVRWTHAMDHRVKGPPTLIGNSVVVADAEGRLELLNRDTGAAGCARTLSEGVDRAGPSVAGRSVIFAGLHGRVMSMPIDSLLAPCDGGRKPTR